MRPSTAGSDSPVEVASRNAPAGHHGFEDGGASAETNSIAASETAAAESGAGSSGGNNTRSFRFLLTLALRKAQTAVTLDNGGHVEEAIRTYREAISMLGLVLNRTNEEDGRQRLLHFQQQQDIRVDSLPILQDAPKATEDGSSRDLLLSPVEESSQGIMESQIKATMYVEDQKSEPTSSKNNLPSPEPTPTYPHLTRNNSSNMTAEIASEHISAPALSPVSDPAPAPASASALVPVSNAEHLPEIKPEPAVMILSPVLESNLAAPTGNPSEQQIPTKQLPPSTNTLRAKPDLKLDITDIPTAEQPLESARPREDSSPLKTKADRLKAKSSHQTPHLSPIILNKPLPPLSKEPGPPISLRKVSGSSASTHSASQHSPVPADDAASVSESKSSPKASPKGSPVSRQLTAQSDLPSIDESEAENDPSSKSSKLKEKEKEKDLEKASRRQSIKSQRSLPAMFGIGLKGKTEKAMPPVPQLPVVENSSANIGRRLFGVLRSSSNNTPTSESAETFDKPRASGAAGDGSSGISYLPPDSSGDFNRDFADLANSVVTASIEDIVLVHKSPDGVHGVETFDAPPPTPSKDAPHAKSLERSLSQSRTSLQTPVSSSSQTQTLTREQKRQSKAAHRLVGLFKRNPSIPEIPSPSVPPKTSVEVSKSGLAISSQSPNGVLAPKDRRLSSSASTPNLIEAAAAAAAACNDQPAQAVYAATERGDIPPMPTPPTLRPSFSSASTYAAASVDSLETTEEGKMAALLSARTARGGSVSDAIPNSVGNSMKRIEDHLQRQQHQTTRPSLRIATKSAGEVLTFVPEHTPLPSAPMTASIDGTMRGRKSSVAAVGSQSIARGGMGLAAGIISNIGSIAGSSSNGASGQPAYGRPTLADVEEDQRLDMFEPSFGTFHQDLGPPPPKSSPLSPLWFVNTLHRSMVTSGAYITTSLYIPRRLWFQTGIRIAAIETKLGVLAQLTQSFASISPLLALPDVDTLLANSTAPRPDEQLSETTPWETEENNYRHSAEKDNLHKSCVALHHWLNNLEESLESNRRLLGKKLKFVNPPAVSLVHGSGSSINPLATASNENLQTSLTHLPLATGTGSAFASASGSNPHDGLTSNQAANASFPNLSLSNGDLVNGSGGGSNGVPMSPLSPAAELAPEARLSDLRPLETPTSLVFGGIASSAASTLNMSRDQLSKDQMANSRFKGFGKLGKSVDRIYSNMQKEKLDDTTAYVAALQRLFEAVMVIEGLMHYFSRVASDAEISGWFTEVPQSPVSLAGKRPHHRPHGESSSRGAASPSIAQATLTYEPSVSSIGSVVATAAAERKSSNASMSVLSNSNGGAPPTSAAMATSSAATAADKKSRRRSNYFGQRQNSSGFIDTSEALPSIKQSTKPRTESFSSIPRAVPIIAVAANVGGGGRFVLPQSPIKNPMSYVQQGMGRAPGVIYARLVKICEWLSQVLLAWVVRDLQVLYAKYIKRLREWVID
ncbi:hypothetical protein H4R99_000007 [Coemansia sp. RSA 1722]|nr:hypothetical protein H4R99_000007 [Coemansia sp. RSA 1722]